MIPSALVWAFEITMLPNAAGLVLSAAERILDVLAGAACGHRSTPGHPTGIHPTSMITISMTTTSAVTVMSDSGTR